MYSQILIIIEININDVYIIRCRHRYSRLTFVLFGMFRMTSVAYSTVKDRSQLEIDMEIFEKNGGRIVKLKNSDIRYDKEKVVRRGLHFTIQHPFISENTGISVIELKTIKRMPYAAQDSHIDKLYEYFKERDLTNI